MLVCVYRTLTLSISSGVSIKFRYLKNGLSSTYMYSISRNTYISGECRQMILDLLIWIRTNLDRTLSFRSSCCEGVCGSCAMLINNLNTLACIQPIWLIDNYVLIYPLPHFFVVRDLIVDLKNFYEQYVYVNPFYNIYDSNGFANIHKNELFLFYIINRFYYLLSLGFRFVTSDFSKNLSVFVSCIFYNSIVISYFVARHFVNCMYIYDYATSYMLLV